MCNFDKNLIPWMDGELPDNVALAVEQHVSACADCRARLAAYENASRDFAAHYAAAVRRPAAVAAGNSPRRWAPYLIAAAAAIVIALVLLPLSRRPVEPEQLTKIAPPVAAEPAAVSVQPVAQTPVTARHRASARPIPRNTNQPLSEPVVQIVIPADAMFPPGAIPDGVAYVANLNYAIGGAMPGYRLQQ